MLVVAYSMERKGVKIDAEYEDVLIPELQKECDDAERDVYAEAGTAFNMNSGQQIYSVLCSMGYGHLVHFGKPTEAMLAKGITKGNPKLDAVEMGRLEK